MQDYNGPEQLESGEVIQADYSNPSTITLAVKTGENGFLVLSDSWYPGWKAYVDNKETKIYKANAAFRGILITGAGKHTVQFRFVPKSFYLGLFITGVTIVGFVLYFYLIELGSRYLKSKGS